MCWILAGVLLATGWASDASAVDRKPVAMTLQSSDFKEGAKIAKKFAGDGADQSPTLQWSKPPAGTKSIAVRCIDPDAPRGTWWHWTVVNIPPNVYGLRSGASQTKAMPAGAVEGSNDFGRPGYNGPAPPAGSTHHYHFIVSALDTVLDLPAGFTKMQYDTALKGHVLGQGVTIGTYSR